MSKEERGRGVESESADEKASEEERGKVQLQQGGGKARKKEEAWEERQKVSRSEDEIIIKMN